MQMLSALGRLFLGAAPTVLIFLLLHFYLRAVLYRPLRRTLEERHRRSAGLLESARARLGEAEGLLAQIESKLRATRMEGYQRVAEHRQAALAERASLLENARRQAKAEMETLAGQLARETQAGREKIHAARQELAEEVLDRLLGSSSAASLGAPPGASA